MFRGLPVLPAALSSRLKSRAARQLENLALLNHEYSLEKLAA
jgi:hypothetical protein